MTSDEAAVEDPPAPIPPRRDSGRAPAVRRRRLRPGRLIVAALLAAASTAVAWYATRPGPQALPSPALDAALETALLGAIAPGWPARKPVLPTLDGALEATEGRIDAIAAVDADADGRAEWGVAYVWLGAATPSGARAVRPGFAVVRQGLAGAPPELLYEAPAAGGWEGAEDGAFEAATEHTARGVAVQWGARELGFLATHLIETSVGGRMARGITRAFVPALGAWAQAWQDVTETRLRHGRTDEVAAESRVEAVDLDGNGTAELVVTPSWYHRHLGPGDRGVHFTAEGPGRRVYRREGATFALAALDGVGPGPRPRVRQAPTLYAVRADRPPVIDGAIEDWDAVELTQLGTLMLEELDQLRYRRRDRRGTHDFSGAVRFMWDEAHLYVRADVMDDTLRVPPPGKRLFEGDHLGLWLDMDLARDFAVARRDGDDWQVGLAPGQGTDARRAAGGDAWIWVPQAGRGTARVASAPLVDPYEGAVRGWRLEAAVPWADLGGPPKLRPGPPRAPADPRLELKPRRYTLRLAGMIGIGAVLTDSDKEPQELAYVSAPDFGWGAPRTFNTLMLVEGVRAAGP